MLESIGIITAVFGVYFAIKKKRVSWLFNCVAAGIYAILFYQTKLYSDMELQGLFMILAAYGYYQWGKSTADWQAERSTIKNLTLGVLASLVYGALFGYLHATYTQNASFPYLDATLAGFSIWATVLASKKKIENWIVWVAVDLVYVYLYMQKELYGTMALYCLFVAMACKGWFDWRKNL